jgi:hypothetical protein
MGNKSNSWTPALTDKFMDLVLDGMTPEDISEELLIDVEKVRTHFKPTFYPDKPYLPHGRRISRSGKKMTELELKIIRKHAESGIPTAHTARMLARKPGEIAPDYYGKITFNQMRCLAPVSDQLLAHHYLFHVAKTPIVSDQGYDESKEEEIEFGGGGPFLHTISGTAKRAVDYPPHIRSLAYYMLYKFMEVTGEWNENSLPYKWKQG